MLCKSNPIRDLTCLKVTWSNSCVIGHIGFHWQREVAKKKGLKWKHLIFMHYWSFHSILFFIFDRGGMERLLHLNSSDTLGGHFIKHLFLVLGLEPFCLLHHRVNKEVETFLRYFGLYYHNRITFAAYLSAAHLRCEIPIPTQKVLFWLLRRPFKDSESFCSSCSQLEITEALWSCVILLDAAVRRWVNGGHKGMDMVSHKAPCISTTIITSPPL